MPQVARELLGEPNHRLSRPGQELRYGRNGSLSVELEMGVWSDFEDGTSGGVLDLVRRERGGSRSDAMRWLCDRGYVYTDGCHKRPERPARRRRTYPTAHPPERSQGEQREAENAARRAQAALARAKYDTHPYLTRKGFPEHRGFVTERGYLLIPIRGDGGSGEVVGLQSIGADGGKRFGPKGCKAKGGGFRLGGGGEGIWYVEGYATALSVRSALRLLYRPKDTVVVAFSSGNLPQVAGRRGIVVADRDPKGAGEKAARATGLPYWLPRRNRGRQRLSPHSRCAGACRPAAHAHPSCTGL